MKSDDSKSVCDDCPYSEQVYVEEFDAFVCEAIFNYGTCFFADLDLDLFI